VIDDQDAGSNGSIGPSAQCGPERHPVCGAAKSLSGASESRPERALAPRAI
jgi:hypothetical protein